MSTTAEALDAAEDLMDALRHGRPWRSQFHVMEELMPRLRADLVIAARARSYRPRLEASRNDNHAGYKSGWNDCLEAVMRYEE